MCVEIMTDSCCTAETSRVIKIKKKFLLIILKTQLNQTSIKNGRRENEQVQRIENKL